MYVLLYLLLLCFFFLYLTSQKYVHEFYIWKENNNFDFSNTDSLGSSESSANIYILQYLIHD